MPNYAAHHAKDFWLEHRHPISLATDDSGVFSTTLSREYELAMEHCNFSEQDVLDVARAAARQSFAPPDVQADVLAQIDAFEREWRAAEGGIHT